MKRAMMTRAILVLGILFLASAGLRGAGPKPQSAIPENKIPEQELQPKPDQIQDLPQNQVGAGKEGMVDLLPLDNLKAEKFKTKDGKVGWKVAIPGNRPLATPAVVDGMVYVGGGFGSYEFYAFDAKSGKPVWAIRVNDDGPTAAVVRKGVVAFNTESCTLFVVDGRSGKMLWSRWLGDPLMSQPAISEDAIFMAFPGGSGHQLIAMAIRDGSEKWRAPIAGDIISAPVIFEDSVYLSTFDGTVYNFRMKDGKLIWKKDFQATSAPWLYKDQIFVSKREKGKDEKPLEGIARLDQKKGELTQKDGIWRKRLALYLDEKVQRESGYYAAQKGNDSSVGFGSAPASAKTAEAGANVGQSTVSGLWEFQGSRPCVYKGKLFLTQGDQVVALNPDNGKELWFKDLSGDLKKIGGHLAAPPSPAGNKLYIATTTNEILILDQNKGKTLGVIQVGSPMRFQASLAQGRIFVGTTTGELISLELNDSSADGWSMWGGGPTHNGI